MSERDAQTLMRDVGGRLAAERVRLGLALDAAAAASGIAADRLAGAEFGECALDEDELTRLADVYGVNVTAFFGGRTTPLQYLAGA